MLRAECNFDCMARIWAGESQGGGHQLKPIFVFIAGSVQRVTYHRKSDHVKMSPDLMKPTGNNLHLHDALIVLPIIANQTVLGHCRFSIQLMVDFAAGAVLRHLSGEACLIAFFNLMVAKKVGKLCCGGPGMGDYDEPGRFPVETMCQQALARWFKIAFYLIL